MSTKNENTLQKKYIEIKSKLDYSLVRYEDRLKLVKEILKIEKINGVEFPEDFWLGLFEQSIDESTGLDNSPIRVCLNQNDDLYTGSFTATLLETISSYLINTPELKKEDDRIKIYHTKEMFDRALQEEEKVKELMLNKDGEDKVDFAIFTRQKNYKKSKDIEIKEKDIKKSKTLTDYNNFLEYLKSERKMYSNLKASKKRLQSSDLRRLKIINRLIFITKKDMVDVYMSEHKPIRFKNPLKDSGSPDWNYLDMMDSSIIKLLLPMVKSDDIGDDLNIILTDLDTLIKHTNFTDKQKEILSLYRDGCSVSIIAEKLDTTRPNVSQILNSAVKRITNQYYKEYEDWYYLNVCKGNYGVCSACGCIKLKSQLKRKRRESKKGFCDKCYELMLIENQKD